MVVYADKVQLGVLTVGLMLIFLGKTIKHIFIASKMSGIMFGMLFFFSYFVITIGRASEFLYFRF